MHDNEIRFYVAGQKATFEYPKEFTSLPDYTAHAGQVVTVVRELSADDEYEFLGDPMYRVRADDGWEGDAWGSELAPAS